jgi:hypothetical protein
MIYERVFFGDLITFIVIVRVALFLLFISRSFTCMYFFLTSHIVDKFKVLRRISNKWKRTKIFSDSRKSKDDIGKKNLERLLIVYKINNLLIFSLIRCLKI